MSYAPITLTRLAAYWKQHDGDPEIDGVNLGIVGDLSHQSRASYHNGKDVIEKYNRTSANDYSIRTSRDRAGLTNAASAIDLGRLEGSLTELWKFSMWFATQCKNDSVKYRDVREVIFWDPAKGRVVGWSALAPTSFINDYGDLSHKTHTHMSFYRDSESRDKISLFSPYFPTMEVPMPAFTTWAKPTQATVPTDTWLYDNEACAASPRNIQVSPGRVMPAVGKTAAGILILGYIDSTPTEAEVKTVYAKPATVTLAPVPVSAPVDCTPIVAAAIAPLQATIADKNKLLAAQAIRLGDWEAYRAAHVKVLP
jgi:hypothetical protein